MNTLHGKLLLIAGHAEVVAVLRDEAFGADGLLAPLAGETGLVPAVALVLHFPRAWWLKNKVSWVDSQITQGQDHMWTSCLTRHDGFLAGMALGGVLIGVALSAEELLILGGEGLVHQGALALEALETVLVPVTVLVGQILTNGHNDKFQ